jgi:hypothetical protein
MKEIPLARLWHVPDGTACLLLKDSTADDWEIRIVRGQETVRSEHFPNPITAMDRAKTWRAAFETVRPARQESKLRPQQDRPA